MESFKVHEGILFMLYSILISGFLEPIEGLHEGYESLVHCTRLFIQIHLAMVCGGMKIELTCLK